jgi:hypothetical protein
MYTDIAYSKPQPDAWQDLVSYAEDSLPDLTDPHPPFPVAASASVVQEVATLDTDPLDSNLYYGLGLSMRDFYNQLRNPAAKDAAVGALQGQFERHHLGAEQLFSDPLDRKRLDGIISSGFSTFQPLAYDAMRTLPTTDQLITEALAVAVRERRAGRQILPAPNIVDQEVADAVSRGQAAARLTALNSIVGSIVVWRKATEAMRNHKPDRKPEDIQDQDLTRVAAQASRLHSEEFNSGLIDQVLVPGDAGNLAYDRGKLPRSPQLPEPDRKVTKILHEQREKCPAVFVGRLTLIHEVLDIVWAAGSAVKRILWTTLVKSAIFLSYDKPPKYSIPLLVYRHSFGGLLCALIK